MINAKRSTGFLALLIVVCLASHVSVDADPAADAGGPYMISEGEVLTLSGSATPDPGKIIESYDWDLDHDGAYDDATGSSPTISWTSLEGLGIADDGTYTITLRAVQSDSATAIDSTTLLILNVGPTADAGGPYAIAEGESVALCGVGSTDPSASDAASLYYEWDLDGDRAFDDAVGPSPSISWAVLNSTSLNDDGDYADAFSLRVTDDEGASSVANANLHVSNAPPNAETGTYTIFEGDEIYLDATASSDPSASDVLSFVWDLNGDGVYGEATGETATVAWSCLEGLGIADNGTYPIGLRITDDDGGQGDGFAQLIVHNAPPLADAGGPYIIDEGLDVQLDASSSSDPSSIDATALTYAWDIDGDGNYGETGEPTARDATISWTTLGSLDVLDDGAWIISVRVGDKDGESTVSGTMLTVANLPPSAVVGGPYGISEGDPLILDGSGSTDPNPDYDPLSFVWDLKDDGAVIHAGGPSISIPWTALLAEGLGDDGTFTLVLTVSDDDGGSDTNTVDWTITNTAPSIIQCPGNRSANLDQPISGLAASFDDPGTDTWSATVDWGDGSSNDLPDIDKVFLLPEHTYTVCAGDGETFTVSVTVSDDNGGTDSCTFSISVINDTIAPAVSFDAVPAASTQSTAASFAWSGVDDHTASAQILFSTRRDGYGWTYWSTNTATVVGPLPTGTHTFEVRAQDEAGNESEPILFEWTIESPPPSTTTVRVFSPKRNGAYIVGSELVARWEASGATAATGTLPNGDSIDTSQIGAFTFVVTATGTSGRKAKESVDYYIVPKLVVGRGQEQDGVVWSFLDRPHETHVNESGDLILEPIRYLYRTPIGISFRLEGAMGQALPNERAYVDVCAPPRFASGGVETCSFVAMFGAECSSDGEYTCIIATDGVDGSPPLLPGRYKVTVSVNALPIDSVWIRVIP